MPRFKSLTSIVICALVAVLFNTSCINKDPLFGNNMVPPGQQMYTSIDSSLQLSTFNVTVDSVVANNISTIMLVGSCIDPLTGLVEASILTNYLPRGFADDTYFGTNPVIDSMSVLINVKFEKGDTTELSKLEIYDFSGFVLKSDKKYFSNFDVERYISDKPLLTIDIPGSGGALTDFMPLEFAKKYLYNEPTINNPYNSDTLFHERFNGLYLKVKSPSLEKRAFYSLSLGSDQSRMFLYYSNDDLPDSALVQRMFFSQPDISFVNYNTSVAIYNHDYTYADPAKGGVDYRTLNDTINAQPKGYMSGPVGLATMVELDTVSIRKFQDEAKAKGYSNIAVNRAELQWTAVNQTWESYNVSYQALGLYYNFAGPSFMPDYDYVLSQQNQNLPTTLGGELNRSKGIYIQDITRYMQSYLSGRNEKTKLNLSPLIPDRFVYSNAVVWGSDAPNPKHRPKLILTYTLVK